MSIIRRTESSARTLEKKLIGVKELERLMQDVVASDDHVAVAQARMPWAKKPI
jgi:hypothetical protein